MLFQSNFGALSGQNCAQKVIDGMNYLYDGVVKVSSQPTKAFTSFLTDQIAPSYWRPNHEIKVCSFLSLSFKTKQIS